jgi:hypothetical protein
MNLSKRETATMLEALRMFQKNHLQGKGLNLNDYYEHFQDCKPLTLTQIDRLCERINFEPALLKKPLGERWKQLIDKRGYLTVNLAIALCDIIPVLNTDQDYIDDIILGDKAGAVLSEITYKAVGTTKDGQVILEVTSQVEAT